VPLVPGKPGGAQHNEAAVVQPQLGAEGGLAAVSRPGVQIHGVEDDLDAVGAPAVGDELLLPLVAHGDHLILPPVHDAVGEAGHEVVGQDKMVGIDHADFFIVLLGQQGGVVLPQIVAVNQVDVPLGAELRQFTGGLFVEAAAHLHPAAGHAHGLQPLHQQPALVVGKEGLYQPIGGEILHQGLHVPLGARLACKIQQIEYLQHEEYPLYPKSKRGAMPRAFHFTGKPPGNQPAFRPQPQKIRPPQSR
jgi:hypothetical protein